uniref:Reverse transcriptase n=1 Tax=Anopheles gambiae TaxID=7165 RepID=Q868R2_ANOGA|nr:reverse transcriptase [Anopheles gambiae]
MLNILQFNANHCENAQDLALHVITTESLDVLLLSEPYCVPRNNGNWVTDESKTVAIVVNGNRLPIQRIRHRQTLGVVAADVGGTTIVSCYVSPQTGVPEFRSIMEKIDLIVRGCSRVLLAGDFNAMHLDWGSSRTCPKGLELLQLADNLGLVLLNKADCLPTFKGNRADTNRFPPSRPDVTFASSVISRLDPRDDSARGWRVPDVATLSDHRYVQYEVGESSPPTRDRAARRGQRPARVSKAGTRWKTSQFDSQLFGKALAMTGFARQVNSVESLVESLTSVCDETMSRVFPTQDHTGRPAYWWTPAIQAMIDNLSRKEQMTMRTIPPEEQLQTELLAARESLRKAIRLSKNEAFDRFLRSIREDVTGIFFRKVFHWFQGARSAPERDPAELRRIVDALFPVHPPVEWPDLGVGNMAPLRSIGLTELDQIAASMHPRKAPGLDGVPNAALTVALRQQPEPFRRVFQECLDMSCFPQPWKKQRLVLLPKPGKSPGEPSSFRPICLLDNTGKALERLLLNRLNEYIEDPESPQLSEQQFGFRRGRSTLQAIQQVVDAGRRALSLGRTNNRDRRCLMVVALDVRNAFNTASWQSIAEALQAKGVPVQLCRILQDYFADRELEYDTADGPVTRRVSAGVTQGSILGPTLWNIMYDGVLAVELPEGASIVGFADDLAILAAGTIPEHAAAIAEEAVAAVNNWMVQHKLSLAPEKTELLMISSKRSGYRNIPVNICGVEVRSKRSIRYLGVMLHDHLSWRPHVEMVADKALRVVRALRGIMRNHSGPQVSKRKLLAAVAASIIRYGAPVWTEATDLQWCRRILDRVQRLLAQGITSAFHSTSCEVAVVLAGELPYHLLAKEDARCYNRQQSSPDSSREAIRQEEKETSLQLWQQQWDDVAANNTSRYLRWAHRQVPDVRLWTGRKHGEVDFYLSQVLSGHAFVHEFLHVFGFAPSPDCPRCAGSVESVAHVMFECPRFADVRAEFLQGVGEHNLGSRLLESAEWWDRIQQAARRILSVLQEDWREEQQTLAAAEAAQPDPASSLPEDMAEAERRLLRRREVRNRSAQRRRQQQRQQRLGDFELVPAVLARAAANEAAEPTGEVEEEEVSPPVPPIPPRSRRLPPSPRTTEMRRRRRNYMQLQYRRRRRDGELGDVPQGRQRRGRIPTSAAELER